ncbi:MAG TPA: hypothetical protein VEG29_05740 [Candidatus Binatia bacterium]|nr:hypothetical protein [Candidatus Binatia bacterium]
MYHPDQAGPMQQIVIIEDPVVLPPTRVACLNDGCPCKDARIVSHRRAAFFAALAKSRGETADRVVEVDPDWSIDTLFAAAETD